MLFKGFPLTLKVMAVPIHRRSISYQTFHRRRFEGPLMVDLVPLSVLAESRIWDHVVFFVFTKNLWATFINFIQVLSAIEYTIRDDHMLTMQIM